MLVRLLTLFLISFASNYFPATSETNPSTSSARPHLVIVEFDPWRMVVGSDSPSFVLYEDGTAIVTTAEGYQSSVLDESAFSELTSALNVAGVFQELDDDYSLSNWTDQPTTVVWAFPEGAKSMIRVYGSLRKDAERTNAPEALLSLFDTATTYTLPNAKPWLPETIEVMIWPYEYAPDPSINWPSNWPALDDPETRKRGDGYSIFLPKNQKDALRDFLQTRQHKGAVEIEGQKWAVSTRLPFPLEETWLSRED